MSPHQKRLNIFETKEQYLQLKGKWAETKKHSAFEHSIYNIVRGHLADRGFSEAKGGWSRKYTDYSGAFHCFVRRRLNTINDRDFEDQWSSKMKTLFGEIINLGILRKAYVLSTISEGEND